MREPQCQSKKHRWWEGQERLLERWDKKEKREPEEQGHATRKDAKKGKGAANFRRSTQAVYKFLFCFICSFKELGKHLGSGLETEGQY